MKKQDVDLSKHLEALSKSDHIVVQLFACIEDLKSFREDTAPYREAVQDIKHLKGTFYEEMRRKIDSPTLLEKVLASSSDKN